MGILILLAGIAVILIVGIGWYLVEKYGFRPPSDFDDWYH